MDVPQEPRVTPADNDTVSDSSSVCVKRPPEDEEPFDRNRVPPKRQALEPTDLSSNQTLAPLTALPETIATEPQLQRDSVVDLVALMHEMQASHAQQIAELRNQQAALISQLDQMKTLLTRHCTSQLGAMNLLQNNIASLSTPQPPKPPKPSPAPISKPIVETARQSFAISSQPIVQPTVLRSVSTPMPNYVVMSTPTPKRELSGTPSVASPSPTMARGSVAPTTRAELTITSSVMPNEPPIVTSSHIDTVPEVWEEYRYGRAGNMSVEKLDALWGPRWRQDAKLRTWYQRRKVIADRIKLYIADGIAEKDAVMEVEKMRRGRTLNWVSRILLEDAKETRKQRKAAAEAALASRRALHGAPIF